jgi:hypothetical protein
MLNSSVTAAENKKVVAWTTFREFVVGRREPYDQNKSKGYNNIQLH